MYKIYTKTDPLDPIIRDNRKVKIIDNCINFLFFIKISRVDLIKYET